MQSIFTHNLLCGVEMLSDGMLHLDLDYPRTLLELGSLPVKVREHLAPLISTKPNPILIGNKLSRYYFNLVSMLGQLPDVRLIWHVLLKCKADALVVSFDSVFLHHRSAFIEVLSFLGVKDSAPAVDTFHQTYFKEPHILGKKYELTAIEGKLLSAIDIQQLDDLLLPNTPQPVDRIRNDLAQDLDRVKPLAMEAFRQLEADVSSPIKLQYPARRSRLPKSLVGR